MSVLPEKRDFPGCKEIEVGPDSLLRPGFREKRVLEAMTADIAHQVSCETNLTEDYFNNMTV